jgi:hypothetical protein
LEQNTMATPWRFTQKNHLKREAEEESAKRMAITALPAGFDQYLRPEDRRPAVIP